ncbi:tRNA-dihydrouridine synthase family protein [Pigmentibacter sp. JX0631]|uniref:tRNA dihydrouridine synthase n=1 Tax=Pigmentibacter sp. JX0631 TaxID=2976982 RepID=UPI002468946A|nr:tRNA-dihydrouridine synthase family protein [Pigmentibacter sp. JX0631]WGL58575.1 tRNA-dihydrouridine synthase family protein [Pigmentibacter sp. JX0631]
MTDVQKSTYFNHSRMLSLGIDFPFLIAPMVGLSHLAFRELIKFYTPKNINVLRFTEMLSTRRIPNEKLDSTNELRTSSNESFYIPQILGNEEKFIKPSIEKLSSKNPWGFDINMGCPVSHTLKHNWGVRLMGDKKYASDIVKIVKNSTDKPVSVKLRGGISDEENFDYLLDFTSELQNAGANFITIHARTRAQKHSGSANWDLVAKIRNNLTIPVIANGDIQTAEDALYLLNTLKIDGAMIARAAVARPWIIWQISELLGNNITPEALAGRQAPKTPTEEGKEYINACLLLLKIFKEHFQDEEYILEKFRFFVATGARWFQFGHHFWRLSMRSKSVEELTTQIHEFSQNSDNPMSYRIKML